MSTSSLKPIDSSDWNLQAARHLLNRAGFGLPHARAAKLHELGPEAAVDYFINYEQQPENPETPNFLVAPIGRDEFRKKYPDPDEQRKAYNEYQQEEREAIQRLKAWWLRRMHTTERPLQEKLALFWHGHFATSAQKVRSSEATYHLNAVLRAQAAGDFKALTIAVGQSPAMLRYLDNYQSTKKSPNENWARELMELFTLGQGQYSENDIKNSARAFTGWTMNREGFVYRLDTHDEGEKTFMGRTGNLDGWDVIDTIFDQPAASQFIAGKLWAYFAYEAPNKDIVKGLADTLCANRFEMRPMLRQLFLSRAFYSKKAVGQQIKSPAQMVVQLASDLEYNSPPYGAMARATQSLGQDLFYPPNVKGWEGNRDWINANTLLIRYNLPTSIATARREIKKEKEAAYMGQAALDSTMASDNTMQADATMEAAPMMEAAPKAPLPPERWNPRDLLQTMDFRTPSELVDAMAARFLSVPLSKDQREVLLQTIAAGSNDDLRLNRRRLNPRDAFAALHLMLSTAEYQLC